MINFNNFPAYDETCGYRFETNPNGGYSVFDKATGAVITDAEPELQMVIDNAAELWKCRCEGSVGEPVRLVSGAANNGSEYMKGSSNDSTVSSRITSCRRTSTWHSSPTAWQ